VLTLQATGARLWLAVALSCTVSALLLWRFHDYYWYPPDEGNYAHVAQRLLQGEVLHRDIQDVHAGYIDFINAGAFALFGERMVVLRYPVVLLNIIQAGLVVWTLRAKGLLLGAMAGIASVCLGFFLFPNPSANWYCLFLFLCVMALLSRDGPLALGRVFAVGAICGIVLMLRQLSGAILGAALLVVINAWPPAPAGSRPRQVPWLSLSRLLILIALLGISAYMLMATDAMGVLLFGLGPVALCVLAILGPSLPAQASWPRNGVLLLGILVGLAPMLVYVSVTDTWQAFLNDAVRSAVGMQQDTLFGQRSYASFLVIGASALATGRPSTVAAGLFWLFAMSLGLQQLLAIARRIREGHTPPVPGPVAVVGCFAALLVLHLPSPLYVGAGLPLVLLGLIELQASRPRAWAVGLLLMSAAVVGWHASYRRSIGNLWGREGPSLAVSVQRPIGLRISGSSDSMYLELVRRVQTATLPTESILSLSSHAEIYFLANRTNPTWFFSLAQGVQGESDLARLDEQLSTAPPRMVIVDFTDQLWSPHADRLARWAARRAERRETVGVFTLFTLPRADSSPDRAR